MIKKLSHQELTINVSYSVSTDKVKPVEVFIGQDRVKRAFDLALLVDKEGYNIYVSGPEGIGKATYTLRRLLQEAKKKPTPEDICYVNNFESPMNPLYLLVPPGMGKTLSQDVDKAIESLKVELPKIFESKEYDEEVARITKEFERRREEVINNLIQDAEKHSLGVIFTPSGIRLLPLVGRRIVPHDELMANPRLQEIYEKNYSAFEDKFREYLRTLREIDHELSDKLLELREKTAMYVVDKVLSRYKEKYKDIPQVVSFFEKLEQEIVKNIDLFMEWHISKGNPSQLRALEKYFNIFKVNVLVDNSALEGAPVVFEEVPSFQTLFGRISYTAEMGVLYADHMSLSCGSLHRARGGYLVLRVLDVLKIPFLWDSLKKVLMHKKIHMTGFLDDLIVPHVGINPQPVPADIKVVLLGDPLTYHLLSMYDPEFNRLFKVKAEFDPTVELNQEVIEVFPGLIKKIVQEEGLKDLTADGLSELLKEAIRMSGSRNKVSTIMGPIVDILREASAICESMIDAKDIRRVLKEKVYRSNLIEEKVRQAIVEGKIIVDVEGKAIGQVNGISVYELGDISFGRPVRISATVYPGEKGVINIEREVELSGPIHSKAVLILSGLLASRYSRHVPLHISCSITFEQSYDEVEGDSASVAELMAILSAISGIPLPQYIAITGSVDQYGNVQPVGGIREKVEGFYRVCKAKGLNGKQGVVLPSRNYDNLVLDDEVLESLQKGEFHIYTVDHVDDVIELMMDMPADRFDRLVVRKLEEFYKRERRIPKKK
ncbi:Lon protease family protein [Thermocrinis minervae]|uniref:endopeptidase La n=1 Tax=Thermocrinis minervae TaxID=381751 RepID=A0A1M6RG88_9AQUI|nr:ATP-binding protein [Thermocrinis minervae]SHK31472.1 lon-related putative ATP-dependent protease [Thermocrinis minervae]